MNRRVLRDKNLLITTVNVDGRPDEWHANVTDIWGNKPVFHGDVDKIFFAQITGVDKSPAAAIRDLFQTCKERRISACTIQGWEEPELVRIRLYDEEGT